MSETWGGQITQKALIALVVFLVLAAIYITVRYERYMALSALATLVFDLVTTAGVYSTRRVRGHAGDGDRSADDSRVLAVRHHRSCSTRSRRTPTGFEHTTRRTFAEQANLAVNQTFMRSINTSLISVLPIVALMVIAVWLLGVGTLMDLALVQLVGVIVGTYSSIFFATPLLVSMRERTEKVRTHTRRVMNRRKPAAAKATEATAATRGRRGRGEGRRRRAGHRDAACRQAGSGRSARPADEQQDRTTVG